MAGRRREFHVADNMGNSGTVVADNEYEAMVKAGNKFGVTLEDVSVIQCLGKPDFRRCPKGSFMCDAFVGLTLG